MKNFIFFISLIFSTVSMSQNGVISGKISENNQPVPFVTVSLDGTELGAITDENGQFFIQHVPYGKYLLKTQSAEHNPLEKHLHLNQPSLNVGALSVKKVAQIDEVTILAKSKVQEVKEQPFAVESIDMKPVQNLNLNVNQVLNQSTGVRIRESGGLGSDFVFSLSGFTGNQVRFFLDGLPTDIMGRSFSINAIPVNNVERVEIYKGVVPIQLGADVLGGAVNIVTNNAVRNFLDVSYGFGSFNTHQASVVGRYTTKKGFIISASAFYNYSDNNFKVDVNLFDKKTGKIDERTTRVPHFNDAFKSATGMVEVGFVNKKWADRLLIGLIGNTTYKEIQQGANMTIVAGEVRRTEQSLIPTLKYEKSNLFVKNLSLRVSGLYSSVKQQLVDTSSRIYNWEGGYTSKLLSNTSGELNWYKTLFTFNDRAGLAVASLNYKLGKYHQFTINNTYSTITRVGHDPIKQGPLSFEDPNTLTKNFTGVAYQLKLFKDRWTTSVFAKMFNMWSELSKENTETGGIDRIQNRFQLPGYGIATSYFVLSYLQLKASFESAYRLPEGYEVFGDGLLLLPNPDLKPEQSRNINAGFLFGKRFKKHLVNVDFNYMYRLPENLIRNVAIGITSRYENLAQAKVNCFEGAVGYSYNDMFRIEVNATYQNILNTSLKDNGEPDDLYGDRLPNAPYLFGNASFTFNTKPFGKYKQRIGFNWTTSYVEEFYLKWSSLGSANSKFIIPRQIYSNASVSFTSHSGRYNVSVSCMNLMDALCYDNFRVQKPGRSFNVKLRYYLQRQ
ncbi:TonB-dependent receptor [Fluviicola sp.]|uniref:TonB-dependent receptor n=1 Tax=Fluviicola sp. TaxID=1917219 RepID=UPI00262EB25F|nr:TonB-dependent receptor [Fluviicola sp.]